MVGNQVDLLNRALGSDPEPVQPPGANAIAGRDNRPASFTPAGMLTQVDIESYLDHLDPDGKVGMRRQVAREHPDPTRLRIIRIELSTTIDEEAWYDGMARFPSGQVIDMVTHRASNSLNQAAVLHHERAGVIRALQSGSLNILVTIETASAASPSSRQVYPKWVALVEERRIRHWWVSSLDRVTRQHDEAFQFLSLTNGGT